MPRRPAAAPVASKFDEAHPITQDAYRRLILDDLRHQDQVLVEASVLGWLATTRARGPEAFSSRIVFSA